MFHRLSVGLSMERLETRSAIGAAKEDRETSQQAPQVSSLTACGRLQHSGLCCSASCVICQQSRG
jgi:hypothetical protein